MLTATVQALLVELIFRKFLRFAIFLFDLCDFDLCDFRLGLENCYLDRLKNKWMEWVCLYNRQEAK